MTKKKKWIIAGTFILAAALAGSSLLLPGTAEAEKSEETTTAEATVMTIENTLSSDGEVEGSLEEELSPHTGYYLEEVKVEAGDALEEGDTILTYTNGTKMTAPYDCVVESWSLPEEEDQLTTDHYVEVAGTDVLQMELSVDEDQVALIKTGDEARVTVSASNSVCEGVVTSVSELGDYDSSGSTFAVKITFENDGNIKLGMSSTASITLERAENAVCVPVDAVTSKGRESYVTVCNDDGTEEETEVTTGISNDAFIQITEGLSEGAVVVVPVSDNSDSDKQDGQMPGGMPGGMPGERPDGGGSDGSAPAGGPGESGGSEGPGGS